MQKIYVDKIKSYQTVVYKNGYRTFKKPEYAKYEREICSQLEAIATIADNTPISVEIGLYFKIPQSYSQKKKNALNGTPCVKKIDVDNCSKLIMDIVAKYYNFKDEFVFDLRVTKRWMMNTLFWELIKK